MTETYVAHIYHIDANGRPRVGWDNWKDMKLGDKLYAAPQREWVGLTHSELIEIYNRKKDWDTTNSWEYEQAIEAKLKEKNT